MERWRFESRMFRMLALLAASMLFFACAREVSVSVPPKIDLKAFPTIGVVEFVSQPPGDLGSDATLKFLGNLQSAQPGVRLLELGSRQQVLKEIGHTELNHRAIRAIGEKYGVAAVLTGTVDLSEPRPDLTISPKLTSLSAKAKIDGRMSARLFEAASGATVWANSSWGSWPVAGVSIGGTGTNVDYKHPGEKLDQILMELVRALNRDLRPSQEKKERD